LKDGLCLSFGDEPRDGVLIGRLRTNFNVVQGLALSAKHVAQVDYMEALHIMFYIAVAKAIAATMASLV
jgi:hypothetical protein